MTRPLDIFDKKYEEVEHYGEVMIEGHFTNLACKGVPHLTCIIICNIFYLAEKRNTLFGREVPFIQAFEGEIPNLLSYTGTFIQKRVTIG